MFPFIKNGFLTATLQLRPFLMSDQLKDQINLPAPVAGLYWIFFPFLKDKTSRYCLSAIDRFSPGILLLRTTLKKKLQDSLCDVEECGSGLPNIDQSCATVQKSPTGDNDNPGSPGKSRKTNWWETELNNPPTKKKGKLKLHKYVITPEGNNTGADNQGNKTRGSKTEHQAQRTNNGQNKTGSEMRWLNMKTQTWIN